MIAAAGASLLFQVVIFPPIDVWPLAFVCFVPWLVLTGASERPTRVYVISYLLGLGFFGLSMRWLYIVTVPGAAVLFSAMALYFPLVACPVRHIVRRRGFPLAIAFPAIWVGCEALRSLVIPRFPWSLLGHSQHSVLSLIQISDITGAYGVSFVVATVNGWLADLALARLGHPSDRGAVAIRRRNRIGLGFTAASLIATIAYGQIQLHAHATSDGPRIAVLQGNYPNYVDAEQRSHVPGPRERRQRYFELFDAAAQEAPDLFLFPETPWPMCLNKECIGGPETWSGSCYEEFENHAQTKNAYIVTGSITYVPTPLDVLASARMYNSAYVFSPDGGAPRRYDKNHLVLIGEYAPFRYGPFRFIYLWINSIVPFGQDDDDEYSLTPGHGFNTFTMRAKSQNNAEYGFATPICFENVMPYISRTFVTSPDGRKRCDFLLNMSNDGWFADSTELPQHLAAAVFRAVENRVGIARAVNTGMSCFIDPDGRVHNMVKKDDVVVGPGVDGYQVARVKVDSRHSIYSRYGDVFAVMCAVLWGVFYLDYVRARIVEGRASQEDH